MSKNEAFELNILSETENFAVWRSEDDDSSNLYHLELGSITLHLSAEEWEELIVLIRGISNK